MENFRRAIGLRIKETKEVYEGVVKEIIPEEIEDPLGGYGRRRLDAARNAAKNH